MESDHQSGYLKTIGIKFYLIQYFCVSHLSPSMTVQKSKISRERNLEKQKEAAEGKLSVRFTLSNSSNNKILSFDFTESFRHYPKGRLVDFVVEDELMEIVHNMRMDSLNFICDYFGPFFSQIFIKVLQWHVVALKKRGKCTIRPPQWMPVLEAE